MAYYNYRGQIMKGMGRTCSMHTSDKMHTHTKPWSENLKVRDHMEDIPTEGKIILKLSLMKKDTWVLIGVDLVQDRMQWQALVTLIDGGIS